MVWGAIAGSVVGGLMANKAAKKQAGAMDAATRKQMQGYTDARPYILDMYKGGTDAMKDQLGAGYYGGPTYAGLNDTQTDALNKQIDFGNNMYGAGSGFMNTAGGFGDNYASLYNASMDPRLSNTASGLYNAASNNNMYADKANDIYNRATTGFFDNEARDLYNAAGQDSLGNAQNYALNNSQGLVDAAMRGANRNLNEVQLTNLNNSASGTGNTNSSRAGVAEAILRRGNAELEADTTARINDNLMGRALSQGNQDFANRMNALGGMKSGAISGLNAMSGALGDLRYGDQAQFNNRITGFNAMTGANNNMINNAMGANAGLTKTYGIGADAMSTGFTNMLGAGSAYQKDLQNTYNDDRARFEGERDFATNVYGDYNSQILGRAPQSAGEVRPNLIDPTMAALGGAQMGMGFGQKIGNAFSNMGRPSIAVQGFNGPNTGFGFGGGGGNSPYLYGDGYLGGD